MRSFAVFESCLVPLLLDDVFCRFVVCDAGLGTLLRFGGEETDSSSFVSEPFCGVFGVSSHEFLKFSLFQMNQTLSIKVFLAYSMPITFDLKFSVVRDNILRDVGFQEIRVIPLFYDDTHPAPSI